MIRYALEKERETLINFLVDVNGEENDIFAREYVECCFSNDYRKPHFLICEINNRIIGAAAYSQELYNFNLGYKLGLCT